MNAKVRAVEAGERLPAADEAPAALRRDVRLLGGTLGRVLEEAGGPELLADVERLRHATIRLRAEPSEANRQAVVDVAAGLDLDRASEVARAFTVYFQLVNLAEEHHRVRTLRERSRAAAAQGQFVRDSLAEGVRQLRERADATGDPSAVQEVLDRLVVHPVLTAHPTEARRRAVVDALTRISEQVERLDDPRLSPTEDADVHRRLLEEVSILWHIAQLRDQRPTPLDEVRTVMSVFDQTLFRVVPMLYRELDEVLAPGSGARPALARPYLRLGSWVGGDRDGNPSVTADPTV
jgi:phosphoenolpyruvate carboxylase